MKISTLAYREIRNRPLRALATLLSVGLGVAGVVAVRLAAQGADEALRQLQQAMAGSYDCDLTSRDGQRFRESKVAWLARDKQVSEYTPLLRKGAVAYAHGKRVTLTAIGVAPDDRTFADQYTIAQGHWIDTPAEARDASKTGAPPANDREAAASNDGATDNGAGDAAADDPDASDSLPPVAIDAHFAGLLEVSAGDVLSLLLPGGPLRVRVAGEVAPRAPLAAGAEGAVVVPLDVLQRAARAQDQIDVVRIVLAKDASVAAMNREVASRDDGAFEVRPPLAHGELAAETRRGVTYALDFAQLISLVLAAFIALNTFLIGVDERRIQWGVLSAVGLTPRQIVRTVLTEAIALGTAGSALGVALGVVAAGFLAEALGALRGAPTTKAPLDPAAIALGCALGPALTLAAAYFPARKAARVDPVEAMRDAPPTANQSEFPAVLWQTALAAWVGSVVLLGCVVAGVLAAPWSLLGGLAMMCSFVLLAPPLLRPLCRLVLAGGLAWLWPIEGELASRQLFRRPRRAALTVAVLIVALGAGIGLGHAILNSLADVRAWYSRALAADIVLLPLDPARAAEFGIGRRSPVEEAVSALDGVHDLETVRLADVRVHDLPVVLVARSLAPERPLPWNVSRDQETQVRKEFLAGDAVIGSALAARAKLAVGDTVEVRHQGRTLSPKIAAVVTDFNAGGLSLYLERGEAQKSLGVDGVDLFLIRLKQDTPRLRSEIAGIGRRFQLTEWSFQDLRNFLEGLMSKVVTAFWVVLALGLLIGAIGASVTIWMNVLEQTREIGLLRIVGMTRSQVRRAVVSQAILLGALGVILGMLAGVTSAYVIHLTMTKLLLRPGMFEVRPLVVGGGAAMMMALIVLSSLAPAWRANRMNVLRALHYE